MENKKDLTKIALAGLVLASINPTIGCANVEADGIILVAGCATYKARDNNNAPSEINRGYGNNSNYINESYSPDERYSRQTSSFSSGDEGHFTPPTPTPPAGNRMASSQEDTHPNKATLTPSTTLTEANLLSMLNDQGRSIYLSLNSEGKALAIHLASQSSYKDKNLAVKEAQRRMNERSSGYLKH